MQKSSVTPGHRDYPSPPEVLLSLGGLTPQGGEVVRHHQGHMAADELWRERVSEKHGVKQCYGHLRRRRGKEHRCCAQE